MTDALETAYERRRDLESRVTEHGSSTLRAVADAYRRFERLLEGYEDSATGTGNFETYVEFQEAVATFLDELDETLPVYAAFEAAADELEQRTLRPRHFEEARSRLAPARELAELLEEWETARAEFGEARQAALDRREDLETHIDELEDILRLGEADLDAPVDRLQAPIQEYNEAVREAFQDFRRKRSARAVIEVVEAADPYPLVSFSSPPGGLRQYLLTADAGEADIPTLLEYADYSRSKLAHYVDDPDELKRRVATNRTYLEGLDAAPLTVDWPPASARIVRFRAGEIESILHRFADETVIHHLRRVRQCTRDPAYDRLRAAARAHAELGPAERERLRSGAIAEELEAARAEYDQLSERLDRYSED